MVGGSPYLGRSLYALGGVASGPDNHTGLVTGIQFYWALSGASDLTDLVGGLVLTKNGSGSPGSGTGLGYTNAIRLTHSQNQCLSHSKVSALTFGDEDWTLCVSLKPASDTGVNQAGISQGDAVDMAWEVGLQSPTIAYGNVTDAADDFGISAETVAAPGLNNWATYFMRWKHSDGTLTIRKNSTNGSTAGTPDGPGVFSDTGNFVIGGRGITGTFSFDGYLAQAVGWRRRLSDGECDTFYNSGTPLRYDQL